MKKERTSEIITRMGEGCFRYAYIVQSIEYFEKGGNTYCLFG